MKSWNTQRARVLRLLEENNNQWVPSYELAAIALQYNARVYELRKQGYLIQNKVQDVNGQVRGAFRLVSAGGQASLFDAGLEARPRTRGQCLEPPQQRSL